MTSDVIEESPLVRHAISELKALGQYDADPEFSESIVAAVRGYASYGHSGGSAGVGIHMVHDLLQFKPLSPLTDNPDEWMRVNPDEEEVGIWQNRRQGTAFSNDGGKTYYLLDEPMTQEGEQPLHESKEHNSAE